MKASPLSQSADSCLGRRPRNEFSAEKMHARLDLERRTKNWCAELDYGLLR